MAKHFRARCSNSTNTWAVLMSFCLHKVNENPIQFGHTYFWENIKIGLGSKSQCQFAKQWCQLGLDSRLEARSGRSIVYSILTRSKHYYIWIIYEKLVVFQIPVGAECTMTCRTDGASGGKRTCTAPSMDKVKSMRIENLDKLNFWILLKLLRIC